MGSTESSKNAKRKSSFDDLPLETVFDILLKLPVKSIIRSTLVNKTWHSIITNPNFISAHIQRSRSCCDESAMLLVPFTGSLENYCSLVSTDTSSLIQKYEIPFTRRSLEPFYASLHGLVLFSSRSELYLWNPSLRTHRALVTSNPFDKRSYRRSTRILLAGLGFHKPTNDYRVVMAFSGVDEKGKVYEEVAPRAGIYSLREHAWKELKNSKVPRLIREDETYVDGRFYWLGTMLLPETYDGWYLNSLPYRPDPEQLRILSFNFDTEEFGELLKLPDEVSSCVGQATEFRLMEFEGSLCVCVSDIKYDSGGQLFYIWSMRSENGVISWSLRFRFLLKVRAARPLNITKSGSLIIESFGDYSNWSTRILISRNLKSMHDRDIGIFKFEEYAENSSISTVGTHFMESLVMYEGDQKSLLKSAEYVQKVCNAIDGTAEGTDILGRIAAGFNAFLLWVGFSEDHATLFLTSNPSITKVDGHGRGMYWNNNSFSYS
uniref:F-box domain-containing protein n=1 Tax=Daucus carota subsp. sativus TaxID=79200 RepID=A0A162AMU1_DAUCS